MTVKPITPDEVLIPPESTVPDHVVEGINALLAEAGAAGAARVVLSQARVLDAIMAHATASAARATPRAAIAAAGWAGVKALYGAAGWAVTVDPPRGDADSYLIFARAARPTPPPSVVRREGDAP